MSRPEWFCQFLLKFPTPSCITSLTRDVFVKKSWDVVGRKQYKQQFLEHLYDVAVDSIALPLSEYSLAVTTFRLQLHRYVGLSAQRLQLEKQSEIIYRNGVTTDTYVRSRALALSLRL